MSDSYSAKNIISNFIWRFLERFGARGVEFVVSIILARILAPDVYVTVALVTVFITVMNVFVDSGLGNALIQKKNADDIDFSSVFFFNVCFCIVLYGIMFLCAPLIAAFYNNSELLPVIRVLSLTLVISGVKNVQMAYVSRNLMFKKFFFSALGGTIAAAFIGIWMAYNGFGVWALATQQLVNTFIDTLILWVTVKWKPQLQFSFIRLKGLLTYGWKLLVSGLLDTVFNEIRQLVIGKAYPGNDLAYYNQGNKYPYLLAVNINASIDSVLLPLMSSEQDNKERVKLMTRRSIKTSIYIMAPIMCGMCATADTLIPLVLTDKWMPCVPFFRVFCITYIFFPIHTANLNAIKAVGRSDMFLKLEIIKKVFGYAILLLTVWFGPFVMACSGLATTWVYQLINSWPNKKLLGYSYAQQFMDIFPTLILAGCMCLAVFALELLIPFSGIFMLVIQVFAGVLIYFIGSIVSKNDTFFYLINICKNISKKGEK